ncbi:MAG: hypothetical protein FIA93_09060 [Deltaproteobacteria bacterium]|nr:hypothetical protein [Deltaproteobacteria bacterium]
MDRSIEDWTCNERSVFKGLEAWERIPGRVPLNPHIFYFVLDVMDAELREFWEKAYPELFDWLVNPRERVLFFRPERALVVKL